MLSRNSLIATLFSLVPCFRAAAIDPSSYASSAIITRDVVIVGGGSSGTYAAVNLKKDGYSVAVVEKKARLGGHVDTFKDPATGGTFDYGVIVFLNTTVVRNYFSFLGQGLALTPQLVNPGTQAYTDFRKDGKIVAPPPTIPWTDPAATFAALQAYNNEFSKYPFLTDGYNLPNPVPEDLLLPFGDFLAKYNLEAMTYWAFQIAQGLGNLLSVPTLYIMKYLPKTTIDAFIGQAPPPVTSENTNNQALYDSALAYLTHDNPKSNVFLSSSVIAINRSGPQVLVAISTPSGPKLIKAKKLLIAVQPNLATLQSLNLDLTPKETTIFRQFNNTYYWNIALKNTPFPRTLIINNIDLDLPLGIPRLPGGHVLWPTTPTPAGTTNYTMAYYTHPDRAIPDSQVAAEMLATVQRIASANGFIGGPAAEVVGINAHNPFWLTVPTASIAGGFYGRLNALQGRQNTWWTGATFVAHDSSGIWEWSERRLLPELKASL